GGVYIQNAQQVNIEKCTIRDATYSAITLAPFSNGGTLAGSISLNIDETVVTGNAGAVRITPTPHSSVTASISPSVFKNNSGAGIRIDGTNGGTVSASISDTVSSMNAGNGIVAVSGPGSVSAHITRSVMAANAAYGVQSNQTNGGVAHVTVNSSTITTN